MAIVKEVTAKSPVRPVQGEAFPLYRWGSQPQGAGTGREAPVFLFLVSAGAGFPEENGAPASSVA